MEISLPLNRMIQVGTPSVFDVQLPDISGSSIIQSKKREMLEEIASIFNECQENNWDDEGSTRVLLHTVLAAHTLVESLPDFIALPSIYALRNGTIAFQWNTPEGRALLLSIDSQRHLTYAAILGSGRKKHGVESFSGALPNDIREFLLLYFLESCEKAS